MAKRTLISATVGGLPERGAPGLCSADKGRGSSRKELLSCPLILLACQNLLPLVSSATNLNPPSPSMQVGRHGGEEIALCKACP